MLQGLEYILKLHDQLSPAFMKAAGVADSAAVRIQNDMNKITGSSNSFKYSLNDLKSRLDSLNATRMSTHIPDVFRTATKEAEKLERQIERIEGKGKRGPGGGLGIGGLIKGNLITGAITSAAGFVKDGATDTYQSALQMSSLRASINSTTGGQGGAAIEQTKNLSNKYGLNYEASLEGVKTLTGGLKSMNLPLAEQMRIFEGVSTGIAAMKLGSEQSKGAMLALGQMASKGTVSAEELRGQLGERIPGAFGIAARAMGVTEQRLGKMMEQGEVASSVFLPKFAAEMQKTFGADAIAAANGPQAIQERFTNAMFNMKVAIGDGFMPLLTPIIEKFTHLAENVIPYIQRGFSFISNVISSITSGTSRWEGFLGPVRNVLGSIWTTVKSIFGNIWNIVKGVVDWMGKSELLKDIAWGIGKVFEGIMWVIRKIGDAIQWVWNNVIKPIFDAIEWVYKKIKGLFTGGKTEVVITDGTKALPKTAAQVAGEDAMRMNDTNAMRPEWEAAMKADDIRRKGVNPLNSSSSLPGVSNDKGKLGDAAKGKADAVNSGGQRTIVINIAKQIGAENIHVMSGAEAANNIESLVREAMRRMLLSLNGNAVANA